MRRFVGRPIAPQGDELLTAVANGEPPLPRRFSWSEGSLELVAVRKTWRSTKTDRGDAYLKRHWFEVELPDGTVAQIYFDREARRGQRCWWLYTLETVDKL